MHTYTKGRLRISSKNAAHNVKFKHPPKGKLNWAELGTKPEAGDSNGRNALFGSILTGGQYPGAGWRTGLESDVGGN